MERMAYIHWQYLKIVFSWSHSILSEGVVEIKGHTQFHGDILMTLNKPACGIIALLRLIYCLKTFSSKAMWPMDLLFERCSLVTVTVCANKALIKHSLFSLYAHMVAVTRLHLKKKRSIHCFYFFKNIFSIY